MRFLGWVLIALSLVACVRATPDYSTCKHIIVGAGIGGIYTAHQLANTSKFPISQICIFEASNRSGGRIYSFRDEHGHLMFDLGGADFVSGANTLAMDSIKDAFGLQTVCNYFLDPECGDNGKYFAKLRGGNLVNQNKGTKDSSTLRYYLKASEQYDTKGEFEASNPFNLLTMQLPVDLDLVADLDSPNKNKAWSAIRQIFEYIYANKVPMTNLSYWETDLRTALYDTTTGARLTFSEEKWATLLQAVDGGEYDSAEWIYHASKYGSYCEGIMGDFGGGTEETFADANGNPIGYATALETLLANFTNHGGRIFYGHQVTSVRRPSPYNSDVESDKFVIEGVRWNGGVREPFKTQAKSTILNMGVQDLNRLSRDSVMWTEAEFDFEYLLKSYGTSPALKGYLHYSDPWWIRLLNETSNAYTTDEPIHFFENGQTWPDCDLETFRNEFCPTWTQVTYVSGLQYAAYWDSANLNRTDAPIWLSPTDPVTAPFLQDAHEQFVEVYRKKLHQIGVDVSSIAPPDRGVLAYWEGGWSYIKTNTLGGRHNRMMRKPLQSEGQPSTPGDKLCIVNTDVSILPGEAEGSLTSALEALLLCYNVQVPNFPNSYYNNIISKVY